MARSILLVVGTCNVNCCPNITAEPRRSAIPKSSSPHESNDFLGEFPLKSHGLDPGVIPNVLYHLSLTRNSDHRSKKAKSLQLANPNRHYGTTFEVKTLNV